MSMCRAAIGIAAAWVCVAAPVWSAEKIYLLEQQVRGSAPYSFRSLGEIEGARRAALPETGGHVLVLTSLGQVWGWGQNLHGQLGTGDRAVKPGFVEVSGLSDATAIAAGAQHSVALKSDGTVWTWGANSEGQLGDGSLVNRARPGIVPGLRDVSMVAAGALFTVVLKSDGTVWVFGSNWNGIAGSDARKLVTEPVRVEGLSDVRAVATRRGVGYALDGQGRIWVWGRGVENAVGTPRVLSGTQRELVSGLVSTGPRLSAEWFGTGIDAVSGVLRMREGRVSRTFAMEGTATDVAAGWAVAVIASEGGSGTSGAASSRTGAGRSLAAAAGGTAGARSQAGSNAAASGSGYQQLVIGYSSIYAVQADGGLRVWGDNRTGNLGDGTAVQRNRPVCGLMSEVKAISTKGAHTVALRTDGTVWTWGFGVYGSLGDGLEAMHHRFSPFRVPSLTGVVAIAAGIYHTLALRSDGTVWAWGDNSNGQLGDGTLTTRSSPVQVPGLTGITSIAAGAYHSLARKNDGAVFAWGQNSQGEVGDGTTVNRLAPTNVAGVTAASVSAGMVVSYAIRNDGTLWGWGASDGFVNVLPVAAHGIIGPLQITNFSDVVQVSGGESLTLILRGDGSVWSFRGAWSDDYSGAVVSPGLSQVALPSVAIGVAASYTHFGVLLSDGTVRLAGSNDMGQLGRPGITRSVTPELPAAETFCRFTPPAAQAPKRRLSVGGLHFVGVSEDGSVWTGGQNSYGQLGIGFAGPDVTSPAKVPGLSQMATASGGAMHTLALGLDGLVRSWGSNYSGALGDGTQTDHSSPVLVPGLTSVTQISAGGQHSMALRSDGSVWCWGSNYYGQIGDGTKIDRFVPTQVPGLQGVVEIAAGGVISLALKSDGTVWMWGTLFGNTQSQEFPVPVQVEGLNDVAAVRVNIDAAMALKRDGTVWMLTNDYTDILGNGPNLYPVLGLVRVDITDVVDIGVGQGAAMAIRADGGLWSWGSNSYGQAGTALPIVGEPTLLPIQVALQGVAAVSLGETYSAIWQRDGRLWFSGWNWTGQFGLAEKTMYRTPILGGFQLGYPVASTPLSAVPVSGDSSAQSFDFGFRSAAGASTLRWVQMLFASEWDGGGLPFCYLHYDVPGNGLWLYGESGYFVGPVAPGTASNLLQNSFCAVDPKKTTITKNGAALTVRAQVLFKQAASRKIFTRSLDFNDVDSGWIQEGTWDSMAVLMNPPSVSPNSGSGASPTFVATFTDASGLPLSTGGWVQFLVAAAADGGGQPFCYLHYDRAGDGLWMYSGDVGFFLGPVKPGVSSTVLQSSACSINTAGTTVQNNAGQLVISSPFTFKSPMTGSKKLFQRSMDALRRDSGWVLTGNWVVP
ncbi:MAG: hypothetical protein J0H49_25535 [Acidobacteria bacterium]|nr:hypothetical protein [Acidobacteriota bacterium]